MDAHPVPSRRPSGPGTPLPPQKTRSVLNLTASTLLGIYSPASYTYDRTSSSGDINDHGLYTPFGTGAQTPAIGNHDDVHRRLEITTEDVQRNTAQARVRQRASSRSVGSLHHVKPQTPAQRAISLTMRAAALFAAGVAYGLVVTRLHESRAIVPIEVQLQGVDRTSWYYLGFWGVAGIILGSLLPLIDRTLASTSGEAGGELTSAGKEDVTTSSEKSDRQDSSGSTDSDNVLHIYSGAEWHPLVRSVGAFFGIAFAIVSSSESRHGPTG